MKLLEKNGIFIGIWTLVLLIQCCLVTSIASQLYKISFFNLFPVVFFQGFIVSIFSGGSGYISGRRLYLYLSNKRYTPILKGILQYLIIEVVSVLNALAGLILSAFLLKLVLSDFFWNEIYSMSAFWIIATIVGSAIISAVASSIDILFEHNKKYLNQIHQLNIQSGGETLSSSGTEKDNSWLKIKYRKSYLGNIATEEIEKNLARLVSEKFYTDPDLTADTLADKLNLSHHQLSEYFSKKLNCTFRKFINAKRLEDCLHDLIYKPEISITQIWIDAGFNSSSTFYREFKNKTGLSPEDYREKNKKNDPPINQN